MRDRLIELIKQADDKCGHTSCGECGRFGTEYDCLIGLIADYLLANGVIVPPCKVGDTLYVLYGEPSYTIKEHEVSTILFGRTHDSIGLSNKSVFTVWEKRWYDYFGKTVFLTREEAEQALKGEQNHDR